MKKLPIFSALFVIHNICEKIAKFNSLFAFAMVFVTVLLHTPYDFKTMYPTYSAIIMALTYLSISLLIVSSCITMLSEWTFRIMIHRRPKLRNLHYQYVQCKMSRENPDSPARYVVEHTLMEGFKVVTLMNLDMYGKKRIGLNDDASFMNRTVICYPEHERLAYEFLDYHNTTVTTEPFRYPYKVETAVKGDIVWELEEILQNT